MPGDLFQEFENYNAIVRENVRCGYDDMPNIFAHLKLLHVNARDLRSGSKFAELQLFADSNNIDIICASETFFDKYDRQVFNLVGFSHHAVVRDSGGGGGVSIYIRTSFEVSNVSSLTSADQKVQILCCRVRRRMVECNLVAVYSNHRSRAPELLNLLAEAVPEPSDSTTLLCGDTNINILENDSLCSEYFSLLSSKGMLPVIEGVTRFESQSCLDHIFITASKPVVHCTSGVIESNVFSDHFPVFAALCIGGEEDAPSINSIQLQPVPRRIFSSANFLKFFQAVSNMNFEGVMLSNNASDALHRFENSLYREYDNAFPVKLFFPCKPRSPSDIYGSELRRQRRQLDRVRRKYFKDKANTSLKSSYYVALKQYKRKVRTIHSAKFSKLLEQNNMSSLWRNVNVVLGRAKTQGRVEKLVVNDTIVTDDKDLADCFSEHFATIGDRTVSHLPPVIESVGALLPHRPMYLPFSITEIAPVDIIRFGRGLKANLGNSLKSVPSKIIKQVLPILAQPLAHIFNLSVTSGIFPDALKEANVLPLYKGKGPKTKLSNYRPISLCPFLAKVFEKCVGSQIIKHLRSVEYFEPSQYGFLSGRSTDLALCDMYDYIALNCAGGAAVLGAFLDTAKAFDCVPVDRLLELLEHIGFSYMACKWLNSYLRNRLIRVRVGHLFSSARKVNMGVPQGSSLGPLIFIIFINVVLSYVRRELGCLHPICFADDLTLLYTVSKADPAAGIQEFLDSVDRVGTVYNSLRLALNTDKTIITFFRSPQSKINSPDSVSVFGSTIRLTDNVKCLGVHLSSRLDWRVHMASVRSKCFFVVAAISRLKGLGAPPWVLMHLYNALLVPLLTYAIVVWGATYPTQLKRLQVVQNHAVRAMFGVSRRDGVSAWFTQNGLLSLDKLYKLRVGCLLFKELLKPTASTRQLVKRPPPSYKLRGYDPTDLITEVASVDYTLRSPRCIHRSIWNEIPPAIRNTLHFSDFKQLLMSHLLDVQ